MSNIELYKVDVDPSKLIIDLIGLQSSLTQSEFEIQKLYDKLEKRKLPIEKALAKYDESYSLFGKDIVKKKYIIERMTIEQVVNLISEVDDISRDERELITNILRKSNENMKKVAQLISGLSLLSNMSFHDISEVSKKIRAIDQDQENSFLLINKTSLQLKEFVYSQYNRISAEKERFDFLINRIETLESASKELLHNAFLSLKDKFEEEFFISMKHEREKYNLELKKWKFFSILALVGGIISVLMMCLFKFVI